MTPTTTAASASSPVIGGSPAYEETVMAARAMGLFQKTPLVWSRPLSHLCRRDVWLKMDCLQTSGSFKDRGMSYLITTLQQTQGITSLVSSSGGNAGLAVATVGQRLNLPVHVVVPETTKPHVIAKLQDLGAAVTIHGENWNVADTYTRNLAAQYPNAAYISPYDHPLLWTGHSTVVDEIREELTLPPAAIIVSVGGGGLLCGVLEGLTRPPETRRQRDAGSVGVGGHLCTVVAAETEGASSFGQSWIQQQIVRLPAITSIATSLGALEVTPVALERAKQHHHHQQQQQQTPQPLRDTPALPEGTTTTTTATTNPQKGIHISLCTDAEAIEACWNFARDHRILVEPACGAALATLYSQRLREALLESLGSDLTEEEEKNDNNDNNNDDSPVMTTKDDSVKQPQLRPIVVEICGGSGVTIELLEQWRKDYCCETVRTSKSDAVEL